ncbi:hypothetical protein [Streptomyces carpinensis]|uniref:Uncharacterized protein n=1 Tax=Streptomyces carpinensis TaxID=66369 RepID=A0ABV1WCT6_9ACTN|nr:hypothetical protein [Streptomyces carpinensis]
MRVPALARLRRFPALRRVAGREDDPPPAGHGAVHQVSFFTEAGNGFAGPLSRW